MLRGDCRGWRVALVADAVANPEHEGALDVMGALVAADAGAVIPPPHDFDLPHIARRMEYVVDDLVEYAANGYRVVAIGSSRLPGHGYWGDLVDAELARRGVAPLETFDVGGDGADAASLQAFLAPVPHPAA